MKRNVDPRVAMKLIRHSDMCLTAKIYTAAQNLSQHWPSLDTETKRTIIEGITEKIVISKDEVIMTLCNMPTPDSGNMAKRWRRGRDLNPRYGFKTVYHISSVALSTTQPPLRAEAV